VLGTPPAFNLSQDQTLHLKNLKHRNEWLKKDSLLDFFGHSVNCTKGIDASPHTNYLQIFKKRPEPLGLGGAHCCAWNLFAGSRYRLPSEGGRIIAMSFNPSTFTFLLPCCLFRVATQAARGAQYSPDWRAVNTLSFFFSGGLFAPPGTGPQRLRNQRHRPQGRHVAAHSVRSCGAAENARAKPSKCGPLM
jgi:hypothetical protein